MLIQSTSNALDTCVFLPAEVFKNQFLMSKMMGRPGPFHLPQHRLYSAHEGMLQEDFVPGTNTSHRSG